MTTLSQHHLNLNLQYGDNKIHYTAGGLQIILSQPETPIPNLQCKHSATSFPPSATIIQYWESISFLCKTLTFCSKLHSFATQEDLGGAGSKSEFLFLRFCFGELREGANEQSGCRKSCIPTLCHMISRHFYDCKRRNAWRPKESGNAVRRQS